MTDLTPSPPSLRGKGVRIAAGLGLAVVLFLAGLAATTARAGTPAPTFRLTNQRGEAIALQSLRGRPVILTFLYTYCADTCPLYLSNIAAGLRLAQTASGVAPAVVVVTVDPDRDSVERLQEYSQPWPADWLFLTGRYQQVAPVWQSYGISVQKRPGDRSSVVFEGYSVSHTAKAVLIGADGTANGELVGYWTPQDLTRALNAAADKTALLGGLNPLAATSELLQRCGELAGAQPGAFLGLVALLVLPGLALPVYLLLALLKVRRADPA